MKILATGPRGGVERTAVAQGSDSRDQVTGGAGEGPM